MVRHIDRPTFSESVLVAAPAERIWPVVTDISLPVRAGGELQAVRWEDGDADASPRTGRRFVGRNANKYFGEWETTSTVVTCDEPSAFAWVVGDLDEPNTRWRFTLEPVDGGTLVTQWGQLGYGDSGIRIAIANMPDKEEKIVARRLAEFRAAMAVNLELIKQSSEGT